MDAVYWSLLYSKGTVELEPPTNASIMLAPKGAKTLQLVDPEGKLVASCPLEGKRPVFYRVRSMSLTLESGPRTEAIIFGRAWETAKEIKSTLWCYTQNKVIDCPRNLIDKVMIELQVVGS